MTKRNSSGDKPRNGSYGHLYTTAPAAAAAGCSESTVRRLVRTNEVRPLFTSTGQPVFTEQNIRDIRQKLGR